MQTKSDYKFKVSLSNESYFNKEISGAMIGTTKDENNRLIRKKYGYKANKGIGYKEVVEGLENGRNDEEIKAIIQQNTRNYAKRQITFFKRMKNHHYLSPASATAEEVLKLL